MEIVATYVPGAEPAVELSTPPVGATLVELRADLLPGADIAALVAACPLPVVLTLRSAAEGGRGPDDPAERRAFYARQVGLPVALFDLEAARDGDLLDAVLPRDRVILSEHLAATPADLEERAHALLGRGTRLIKQVSSAACLDDVLAVIRLARAFDRGPRAARRAVIFASGAPGRCTRLLGPLLGAPVAYAAWSTERVAAPGQYTAGELTHLTGHLGGAPRRLFAVLGMPVTRSLSPALHAAAYRTLGLPHLFVPLEVKDASELAELLRPEGANALDRLGLPAGGFAVTTPWKEAAAAHCELVAPRAVRARGVNTVLPRGGRLIGDTTDADGVVGLLTHAGLDPGGCRAVVLGAGAAARAVAVGLDLAGAEVTLVARDPERAREVARQLGLAAASGAAAERADVVVNATPAGAGGDSDPFLEGLQPPAGCVLVDLPYGDGPTFLAQLASRRELVYLSGREFLLFQGISQFAAMNQVAPPVQAMAAAIGLEELQ